MSNELWAIGQVGAVVLLFAAGLETDRKLFMRYAAQGALVATGGVIFPVTASAGATVLLGFADDIGDSRAFFMGAVMVATSVGITARVLSERRKLDTPEGVTVLVGAVIDDVLGILVLTVVSGIADTGSVSTSEVFRVAGKALGFWIGLTVLGLLLAQRISSVVMSFKAVDPALGLALALFASGLAETFGLAMIIGAYSIGLPCRARGWPT